MTQEPRPRRMISVLFSTNAFVGFLRGPGPRASGLRAERQPLGLFAENKQRSTRLPLQTRQEKQMKTYEPLTQPEIQRDATTDRFERRGMLAKKQQVSRI